MQREDDILQLAPPPGGQRIAYGEEPLQFGELRLPEGNGPHPTAIVIHGGFWRAAYNLDHIGHLCVTLNGAGIATWALEYRRIGNRGGGWPGTFNDISAGGMHLQSIAGRYNLDRNRTIAVGHSAGGQLALWLAAQREIDGVLSLAGVADLRRAFELKLSNTVVADLLGGTPELVPDRYRAVSPIELLPLNTPQRLIHGTLDNIVPFEISKRYAEAAQSHGDDVQLIPVEGAGHFELIDPRKKEFDVVKRSVLQLCKMI